MALESGAAAALADGRLLTFRVGATTYGLAAERVQEVVRMPRLSRVPHAPASLLGLANLRGAIIPVVSLARMLDRGDGLPTRLIVVEQGEVFGLAVDEASRIVGAAQRGTVQELDLAPLLARNLPARLQTRSRPTGLASPGEVASHEVDSETDTVALIAFAIGNQEFALPVAVVDEVLPFPADIARMPDADAAVIGSAAMRGRLLPLLSLRALLGLPSSGTSTRVLVARIGRHRVGLAVDEMRAILQVPTSSIDVVPQVLNRGASEARIQAICRLDGGDRLVSVLAADQLLRQDLTAQLLQGGSVDHDNATQAAALTASEQFLVFRIGGEEFALPIGSVEEVALLPDKLTRLPKAPTFVQGVMNLRGQVIPVIDQAQRFGDMPATTVRRRVIVVRIGDLAAGFIVDAVSKVVAIDSADLRPAPDLGSDQTRVFERVANLTGEQRIILIIAPRELLDRVEQDVLRELGKSDGANSSS